MPAMKFRGITFDAHTLLFSSLAILCGYQSILFAVFTKVFAISEGLHPQSPRLTRFFKVARLELGLISASLAMLMGIGLLAVAIQQWVMGNFGHLEYAHTMRLVVPGATLTAVGFQTILSSFFVSILGMHRK